MNLRNCTSLSVALLFSLGTLSIAANSASTHPAQEEAKAQALVNYGKLPLSFEENRGQTDARVKFLSHGSHYSILLAPSEVSLKLQSADKARRQSAIRMTFPGAQSSPVMAGGDRQSAVSSYFIGNDPAKWVSGAPNYARVQYRELYAGVDLAFYGNQGQLEYDFVVAPGADPKAIRLQFDGVDDMHLDPAGNLVLSAAHAEVQQHKPVIYQEGVGGRQTVEGRYVIQAHHRVAFEIAKYDSRKPLVIDPTLTFATYLGSKGEEVFGISAAASTATYPAVAVDLQGNVYVTGYMGGNTANFPGPPKILTAGGEGGGTDVFVVEMNPTGTALLYSVVIGTGSNEDIVGGIAVDTSGNAYITGHTNSANFPITPTAPQRSIPAGSINAFVTEVNMTGTALLYSTYLGGSGSFAGNGIAVDRSGNAYVTGTATQSLTPPYTLFPLVNPILSSPSAGFLTEIDAAGTAFTYSTFLGAGIGYGVAVDSTGDAYVTGSTANSGKPSPAQGYVLKVNADGAGLGYGPILLGNTGTALQTIGFGIALDAQDDAYVTGMTNDPNFPQVLSAAQPKFGGGLTDGFAIKLNLGGGLVYGTYIGGLGSNLLPERGSGIGVDLEGNAYVAGTTQCIGFPTASPISGARNGAASVLMKGTISGLNAKWSSANLSGSFDQVDALAFDPSGNLYAGTSALNAAGGGIYKLAFGGSSWTYMNSGITSTTIDTVAVDPNATSTVYAIGSGFLFQTTNGGTSWTKPGLEVGTSAVMAIAKTTPTSTLYVGSSAGLVYSTNSGTSWTGPTTPPPAGAINALIVDPNNLTTAYAATPVGVYQTVNGGAAWTGVNNGLPTVPGGVTPVAVTSLAIYGPTKTIYAATGNGLYYSTNAGGNWTQATIGTPEPVLNTPFLVAVDAGDNVYVAFEGAGIATGTNGGTQPGNWSLLTYNGLTQNQILALAAPPTGSGTAYAGIFSATTAFLTKISPTGQSFLSSTCIGGSDNNLGQGIAVTPGGSVAVSGLTYATNFPATKGAIQTANAGLYDAFAVGVSGAAGSGGPPTVVVQSPLNGSFEFGNVTVSGYALDTFGIGATTINTVQVWLDGSYLTNATYGVNNPGACTPYPTAPGCPNVGFTYQFSTNSIAAGYHTLDFYALDNSSPANIGSASFQFDVRTKPYIPDVFGSGPGPDVIWEEPVIGWAQVWYTACVPGPPCYPPAGGAANVTQANPWNIVGIGDFNGDGAPDIVWQDPVGGAVQIWYLGGPQGVTLMSAADISFGNPWRVASVADFNQDGHPDILWQDPTSGFAQIWYMGGPQGTTLLGAANLDLTNPWNIVGTGDFNNDGVPDVLWQDPVSGTVQIWYMGGNTPGQQGTQLQYALNLTGAMSTKVVAIADFNNDGHPDVIFQNPSTGAATVYFYTGTNGTTANGTSVLSTGNPWYIAGPH